MRRLRPQVASRFPYCFTIKLSALLVPPAVATVTLSLPTLALAVLHHEVVDLSLLSGVSPSKPPCRRRPGAVPPLVSRFAGVAQW